MGRMLLDCRSVDGSRKMGGSCSCRGQGFQRHLVSCWRVKAKTSAGSFWAVDADYWRHPQGLALSRPKLETIAGWDGGFTEAVFMCS